MWIVRNEGAEWLRTLQTNLATALDQLLVTGTDDLPTVLDDITYIGCALDQYADVIRQHHHDQMAARQANPPTAA